MGINLDTQWDINSRSGFLTEQLHTSPAFFTLGVATDPSNSSRNILSVCDQILDNNIIIIGLIVVATRVGGSGWTDNP